jgi:2-polyprenyl-3-methyl-5-hydroxy-6-metoxy-1,4-benzoquinol methylase
LKKQTELSLAKSLETTPSFLPYLPELLVDLWDLGCSLEQIVEMVGQLNLPSHKTRVLDLGCGKGAISISLAKEFAFNTTGIDSCKAFLEIAIQKAEEFQVSHLCNFEVGDIREFTQEEHNFDLVIYASMGNVLGNYQEIIGKLRKMVRPAGYIVIDDGFLKGVPKIDREGYEHYFQHDEVIRQLISCGDKIIQEVIVPDETVRSINYGYLDSIRLRAKELVKKKPELKVAVLEYIKNQEIECKILDKHVAGVVWLLQRTVSIIGSATEDPLN